MDEDEQLEIAAAALADLQSLHERFMATVSGLKDSKVNGAEFGVDAGVLFAVCLGVRLNAPHRFIALAGALAGIEYTFLAEHGRETLPILSIYLMPNRRVYLDSGQAKVVCDASNQYLPTRLAPHLASALLASPIFAARS